MKQDELLYLLALLRIKGVGSVVAKNLIAFCGTPKGVFAKPKGWLRRVPEVGDKLAKAISSGETLQLAEEELKFCEKHSIEILTYTAPDYPERLKTIYDAPLALFKKGNLDLNSRPAIAIVGTRKMTPYGKREAQRFAEYFASYQINVVSGLALGVDITAHLGAMDSGGVTTAVLAHGLDRIYPERHTTHARRMVKQGAIVSEYFTHSRPSAKHFPQRNRIISGIAQAVVVIEAKSTGGALLTSKIAFDQNREVYAVPGEIGRPSSAGMQSYYPRPNRKTRDRPPARCSSILGSLNPTSRKAR